MADILTDYREWRDAQPERVSTHGEGCHMWHRDCMIHRLARELERTRAALFAVAEQDGTLSVSEGRLFVDVDGLEEFAFDYATPPTQSTPNECTKRREGT
jgi:hypothetical protein